MLRPKSFGTGISSFPSQEDAGFWLGVKYLKLSLILPGDLNAHYFLKFGLQVFCGNNHQDTWRLHWRL